MQNSKRLNRISNFLLEIAAKNQSGLRARVASAIIYRGNIVSIGVNKCKTDPFQARFGKNPHAIYVHSEISAIKQALNYLSLDQLKKCDLYIVRATFQRAGCKTPQFALAKPCVGCLRCITEFDINQVFFSDSDGKINKLF